MLYMNVKENEGAVCNTDISLGMRYRNSSGNIHKHRRIPIKVKKKLNTTGTQANRRWAPIYLTTLFVASNDEILKNELGRMRRGCGLI